MEMISSAASSASASAAQSGHNKREKSKLNVTRDLDDDHDGGVGGSSCIIDDNRGDVDVDVDDVDVGDVPVNVDVDVEVPTQKPHFLDDAMPPPDMVADFERVLTFGAKITDSQKNVTVSGEQLKMDKKYERDGEISDYELAASGYTKKEFTQDDNTLNLPISIGAVGKCVFTKPKHFLDENPIPPDYMVYTSANVAAATDHADLRREHHSLDRNFERREEEQKSALLHASQLMKSSSSSSGSGGRKSSLDRLGYGGGVSAGGFGGFGSGGGSISYTSSMSSSRTSRERNKDHNGSGGASYTLSRFLHSAETPSPPPALQRSIITTKGGSGAWTHSSSSGGGGINDSCSFDRLYGSLPMTNAATASVTAQTGINTTNTLGGIGGDNINSLLRDGSRSVGIGAVDDIVDVDRLGPKVECVYSLLSMLGSNDPAEMSKKFLELSRSSETCSALRRAGCVPLLVQMMHSADGTTDDVVRKCASMALHNVVHSHPDEKAARREAKVLRLLEQILDYCNFLKTLLQSGGEAIADDSERHPLAAISSLMKVSFDEEHRHAMCELGALQAIPNLVHLDHAVHGPKPEDQCCNSLRRYALMALTNLTFGDEHNKAYLCSQKLFMEALVAQLDSAPDDLLQVTASVLRNLSWRADSNMKAVLNEIGTVTALAHAAMKNKSENTLKAILSALWNLSAHCSTNKAEFCAVDGALAFLVDMLTYEGPSKTLKIIENAGGILRNVSSHIAVREHYRQILRERNCLAILLQQLKSESLTVVSNSCGTLWNLSARCPEDQKFLWDNGAVPMLRSLIHSKHAMISEGSASALKNLLNFRPAVQSQNQLDPIARSMGLRKLPTLNARKQKALQQELGGGASSGSGSGNQHAETCDNLDGKEDQQQQQHNTLGRHSTQRQRYAFTAAATVPPPSGAAAPSTRLTRSAMLTKSESRDSVFSAKSDTAYENFMRSHSASDAGGRSKKMPYAAAAAAVAAVYTLENDVEATEVEQPIDYSAKYCEKDAKITVVRGSAANPSQTAAAGSSSDTTTSGSVTYQETDLDQPTDFSLRYAEQQIETELDVLPPPTVATEQHRSHSNYVSVGATPSSRTVAAADATVAPQHNAQTAAVSDGNEILLILGDTVKCYQTEDTPYVISNAASVTDLRQAGAKSSDATMPAETTGKSIEKPKKCQRIQQMTTSNNAGTAAYGSGSYTPEKPINYCEEGTPGYFSRYESLSSLDESPPPASTAAPPGQQQTTNKNDTKAILARKSDNENVAKENLECSAQQVSGTTVSNIAAPSNSGAIAASAMNSAQETPLMFSRHSSMDSLVEEDEEEIGVCDDKSSVVSDFSRLASGVISPSEIPDSPTQSMPQSPRRSSSISHVNSNSAGGSGVGGVGFPAVAAASLTATRGNANGIATSSSCAIGSRSSALSGEDTKRPLRSVFEDGVSTFHVENTPAQFSCRTSLSNLSILDDENTSPPSRQALESENSAQVALVSEGEEEESADNIVDDILLANCINVGMNRTIVTAAATKKQMARAANRQIVGGPDSQLPADEPKHYYTEDTPALLSKVGSNTNLSAISICSSNCNIEDIKELQPSNTTVAPAGGGGTNRNSLTLSDDVSSNASESGAGGVGHSFDLLQQCIEVGMKKPLTQAQAQVKTSVRPDNVLGANNKPLRKEVTTAAAVPEVAGGAPLPSHQLVADPIAMLRRGGNVLPPYLPVSDEMSKYLVEDSPCNFSVASGLSNLTVGSSLVGPAVQLKGNKASAENIPNMPMGSENPANAGPVAPEEGVGRMEPKWQDDSLSSLSIDSEDDTNLLSQAIAAGCNRPKSNLGFSRTSKTNCNNNNKRISLSASQPIPISATASSTSSLNTSRATARHYQRQQQHQHPLGIGTPHDAPNQYQNGNDSYSSVDSSDSNDNQQAKSLFELCIRTGMHKSTTTRDNANNHNNQHRHHHRQHLLGSGNNRRSGIGSEVSNTTQSNPNLKHFDSFQPLQPLHNTTQAKPTNIATATALPVATTTVNRHLRERERKDEKLLLECINTGISKKIGGHHSSSSSNSNNASSSGGGRGASGTNSMTNDTITTNKAHLNTMPILINNDGGNFSNSNSNSNSIGHMGGSKNVLATSAAAPVLCHQHAATLYSNVHSTAAPDVAETNTNINSGYSNSSNVISSSSNSNINTNTTTATAITTTSNSSSSTITSTSNNSTIIHNNDTNTNNVNCWACWAALKEEQEEVNKHLGDIIDVAKSQAAAALAMAEVGIIGTIAHSDVNPPNHVNAVIDPNKMSVNASDIGCKKHMENLEQTDQLTSHEDEMISQSISFDNTATSDDSNESFIIETTVSLEEMRQSRTSSPPPHNQTQSQKHKDPDLMLKSVERLTMEFVASAEQLRTNASNIATTTTIMADGISVNEKQMASTNASSISIGGGGNSTSNNTWNEDTCPNDDISFPSLSITVPVVASLKYDNDDDDESTDMEHKDLHDFAEITPINEEQSKVSLILLEQVDTGAHADAGATQPSSLDTETETDTLINDVSSNCSNSNIAYYNANAQDSSTATSSSGINFQLGGAVKSAAALSVSAVRHHNHMLYGNNGNAAAAAAARAAAAAAAASMTNSAIIAIEARALAENLQNGGGNDDHDDADADSIDLTFSVNSLDLDNIRPPSGMESLNISGYYYQQDQQQQQHSNAFPSSLGILQQQQQQQRQTAAAARSTPQSPQMMLRSPKFPRKSLPHGLVAKRALGQMPAHLSGSAESVNSSCNMLLENIKPPSLMDELLDSMISVASIQSEVADGGECSMSTTLSAISNYETAAIGDSGDLDGCYGGEYDDNTITLQSCYDTMPNDNSEGGDDNSFHSGAGSTPLPTDYDYEFSSAESTPQKSAASPTPSSCGRGGGEKRTLTPKQKRKEAKDRYKTYTISSSSNVALNEERRQRLEVDEAADETLQIEIVETEGVSNAGSTSRRRVDTERYRTQTIVYTTTTTPPTTTITNHDMEEKRVQEIQTNDDDCSSENISSLRALTQKFKFINMPIKSSTAAAAPEAEANEERGAPDGGDCTSMECDQNSETESCHDQRETYATKNVNNYCGSPRNEGEVKSEENEIITDDSDSEEEQSIAKQAPRARIAKPDEMALTTTTTTAVADAAEEQAKVVRGRKKPAYISPYSMQYQQRTSSPQMRIAANKTLTPATVATAQPAQRKRDANSPAAVSEAVGTRLNAPRKGQLQVGANAKSAPPNTTTSTAAAAQKVASTSNASPALERQGTFVQEEPTIATCQVPVVVSDVKTATATATVGGGSPQRSSKLPTKRTNAIAARSSSTTTTTAATQPTATTTAAAARKIPIAAKSGSPKHRKVTSLANTTKTTATSAGGGMPQRSNSNATIRVTSSSAARIQRISATTPPTRSNSSLNSRETAATAAANSTRNAAAKINQAQSRIANIWKRVNDVKSKQLEQQKLTTPRGVNNNSGAPRFGNTAVVSKLKMTTNAHKSGATTGSSGQRTTLQQRQQQPKKQTLIRSSTFDNTPNGSSGGGDVLNTGVPTKVAVNATTNNNDRK